MIRDREIGNRLVLEGASTKIVDVVTDGREFESEETLACAEIAQMQQKVDLGSDRTALLEGTDRSLLDSASDASSDFWRFGQTPPALQSALSRSLFPVAAKTALSAKKAACRLDSGKCLTQPVSAANTAGNLSGSRSTWSTIE